jgi:hypothetical protein
MSYGNSITDAWQQAGAYIRARWLFPRDLRAKLSLGEGSAGAMTANP